MKITKRQLRRIIKESIAGSPAAGPNTGIPYTDIVMDALADGDAEEAAQAIISSFMMDDTWQQEEDALEDQLAALSPSASQEEVGALADQWLIDVQAGKFRPSEDQYKEQWKTGSDKARARYEKNKPSWDAWREGKNK